MVHWLNSVLLIIGCRVCRAKAIYEFEQALSTVLSSASSIGRLLGWRNLS